MLLRGALPVAVGCAELRVREGDADAMLLSSISRRGPLAGCPAAAGGPVAVSDLVLLEDTKDSPTVVSDHGSVGTCHAWMLAILEPAITRGGGSCGRGFPFRPCTGSLTVSGRRGSPARSRSHSRPGADWPGRAKR